MTLPFTIAHYKLTAKLGEGGMGAVYRATDTKLGRDVAIKILPESYAQNPERLARFTREAQVLASLNHPNIAAIHGVEDRALVMELVEGGAPAGPLSPEAILPLVHQLIDALEYAHERGIVHRDLKPANIRVTPDGALKLLDFGLAKAVETTPANTSVADSPTITIAASLPGVIMGTAAYMSPEQARGGKVDHRTDIWAFGAVLFELLTGKSAFPGDTVSDVLAGVLKSEVDFSPVPARYRPLVERCLTRDLKRRLGWIGEARMLLETPAPASAVKPTRRLRTVAAAVVLLAAGFAASLYFSSNTASNRLAAAKVTRVTVDSTALGPAISPDGKLIAYGARREGRDSYDLWVQQIGGGAAIRLTDDPAITFYLNPVFSADSSKLYYLSFREPAGTYEVPVLGGEARLVVAGSYGVLPSPDGKWLASRVGSAVQLRAVNGGEPRVLFQPGFPFAWSPDSTRLLIGAGGPVADVETRTVMIFPIDGSAPTALTGFMPNLTRRGFSDLNNARVIAWLPGGDIVFNARFGDATNLFRIPLAHLADAMPSAVTLAPWHNASASISGNRLVFSNLRSSGQIWRLPADLDSGKVNGVPERLTGELVESQFPDVRPDDSLLAFISRRAGGQGLYLMDLKTRRERLLYQTEVASAYSTFSPDGTHIAFGNGSKGFPAFTIPTSGGDPKPAGSAGGRIRGWTRDGRYLLVWRVNPGRPTSIGVLDLNTSLPTETLQGATATLGDPRLSPDNRWVAFGVQAGPASAIALAPFRGAVAVPESDWIRIGSGLAPFWSPDSRSLYFARYPEGSSEATLVMRQPLDPASGRPAGPATTFYRFASGLDLYVVNTPTSTRTHLYTVQRSGSSEIWMMDIPK